MEDIEARRLLTQYIQSGGKLGAQPDWYPLMMAARYLGVAPWELEGHAIWVERACMVMDAEHDANRYLEEKMRARSRNFN